MFNAYEFSFDGESCDMYGLMIYDFDTTTQSAVSFGNVASIVESTTNRRIQPIHFGVNYNTKPLEFTLVFGSERELDRYEMQDVAFWLTGHQQYRWLTIGQADLENVQFRCLVTELTPIFNVWVPMAYQAKIRCDCPYAYGLPFEESYAINGSTDVLFRNDSSVREYIKPNLTFSPSSGMNSLTIVNHDDNDRTFMLEDLPSSCLVEVDNVNGIIQDTRYGYNLYDGFNLNFFRLVHGDNNLTVTGNGTLTISGRLLYNVAA